MNTQMDDIYNEREDYRVYGEIDLERRVEHVAQVRCLKPWSRCWDSGKKLFMKRCVKVTCCLYGPGDPVITVYYFEPKYWTLRLLKK